MAISPGDASKLTKADKNDLTVREAKIDAYILERVRSGSGESIWMVTTLFGSGMVREELLRRYRAAGWTVKHQDERGESAFVFTKAG